MKRLPLLFAILIAGCSGNGASAASGGGAGWPAKWCQAQPGMSKEQLVSIMGQPTQVFPEQMAWSDHHWAFYAFLEHDGSVKQLDINKASLTDAEKANLPCSDVRTRRSMAAHAVKPHREFLPACEIVTQAQMTAIIGTPVVAHASGRSKCIYQSDGASHAYAEFSVDPGDGAAAMAGAGFAAGHEPGLTSPYDGIGDQAVAVGPALLIRTGDDLVTIVLSGVSDAQSAAKKIFGVAKAKM